MVESIGDNVEVSLKLWSWITKLGQGVEHGFQKSDEVLPQPLQVSELPGLFFHLAEEVADGLRALIPLQEVGQQAVTKKGLGDGEHLGGEGAPLFLAQTQALLGFFEKDLNGPAAQILLHHLDGVEAQVGGEKRGPGRLRLDLAARPGFQVLYSLW